MAHDTLRLLGLTLEKVADFRENPSAKSSGLYAALDRRYSVVGVVRPTLSPAETAFNRATHIHPNRTRWLSRNQVNFWAHQRRTAHAESALAEWEGRYDLIVQLHTIFAPGRDPRRYNYVLHTDNTYILSERHYPGWTTMGSRRERDAWVRAEGEVYRNAAYLFPRSAFLARSLVEDYGCDPARVVVVGGGSNYGAQPLDGKRYDTQTALFVGIDFERKGGQVLLEAWAQVRRALPQAKLWVVGPKRPVREVAGVEWLGRIADRAELSRRYREATAFVMPSLFEPWGHVFFEAMSFGLPCVGSTACAMPEIIQDGLTGRLAATGQAAPLAAALIELLGDPQRAETLGRAAAAHVAHGHTWDDVVARMAPAIEQAALAAAPKG